VNGWPRRSRGLLVSIVTVAAALYASQGALTGHAPNGVVTARAADPAQQTRQLTARGAATAALPQGGDQVTLAPGNIDLHDGMVAHYGSTYYLYGTRYGCGFSWGTAGTPWCGFGVSTSSSINGPWSAPRLLFPTNGYNAFNANTWAKTCSGPSGNGCFNARMARRPDGVYILSFNAPGDYVLKHANAYYFMGCNGPAGPCGPTAGAPNGSVTKPRMYVCSGNGDHTIVAFGSTAYIVCTQPDLTLDIEQLDRWWVNGNGTGARNLAGLTDVESPGMWRDAATGTWLMTYSSPHCGYCAGTGTGYATAAGPLGPWTFPANVGFSAPVTGRRDLSATSCGGQPRTVSLVDGQAYEDMDMWTGQRNETNAGQLLEPLTYTPTTHHAGDGLPWIPPFDPFPCT
jgi:hypothetical protein